MRSAIAALAVLAVLSPFSPAPAGETQIAVGVYYNAQQYYCPADEKAQGAGNAK
jgi:hypothetical protein